MITVPEFLLQKLSALPEWNEAAFVAAQQQAAVTSIRLNKRKASNAFASESVVPWCQQGRYLRERPYFTHDPLLHAGAYYVQEASSMFIATVIEQVLPKTTPIRALDLCAAPGGKSTLLADCLPDNSLLVSNEIIRTRVGALVENLSKWGATNTIVTSADPLELGALHQLFDLLLIDAPCSGSGLFRKDANAINEWSPEQVMVCQKRQQRIIHDSWSALRVGGYLIYSTCSFSPEENEEVLDSILNTFHATSMALQLPEEWGIQIATSHKYGGTGYRFSPHRLQGEGFFLACFKKEAIGMKTPATVVEELGNTSRKAKSTSNKVRAISSLAAVAPAVVADWIAPEQLPLLQFFEINGVIRAFPKAYQLELNNLRNSVFIAKAGVAIGQLKGKDLIPDHELALSHLVHPAIQKVALSKEQAIAYLKKEELHADETWKGWLLVSYEQHPLGWIKALPGRVNNYYPKEWRILK